MCEVVYLTLPTLEKWNGASVTPGPDARRWTLLRRALLNQMIQ